MKNKFSEHFKKYALLALLSAGAFAGYAQGDADPYISLNLNPASITLGSTSILQVTAYNAGTTSADSILANSLTITISVGLDAEIMGINTTMISDPKWSVVSLLPGTNNTIKLRNNATLLAGDVRTIYLTLKGTAVLPSTLITGNIGYNSGNIPLTSPFFPGMPIKGQGNLTTSNDNSVVSLVVTPAVLPVALSSFTAKAVPGKCAAQLVWTTGEEKNFDHFSVQYSTDGAQFEDAGNVKSNGNVMGSTYNYTMEQPAGKTYYRLKTVDKDGAEAYSKVVVVTTNNCNSLSANNSAGAGQSISIAPNPTCGMATVTGLTAGQRVLVCDMLGHQTGVYHVTNTALTVDLGTYAAGTYFVSVVDPTNNLVQTIKLIKY